MLSIILEQLAIDFKLNYTWDSLQREARTSEFSLQWAWEGTPPYPTCCWGSSREGLENVPPLSPPKWQLDRKWRHTHSWSSKTWRLDIRRPISYSRTSQNTKWSSAKYLVRKLPDEGTCVPWVQNGGIHGL